MKYIQQDRLCRSVLMHREIPAAKDYEHKIGGNVPSHLLFWLLMTKTPERPDRLESQTPVDEVYPTQDPARLTRGAAQERH